MLNLGNYEELKSNEEKFISMESKFKYYLVLSYLEYELGLIIESNVSFKRALNYFYFEEESFKKSLKMATLTNNLNEFIDMIIGNKQDFENRKINDKFVRILIKYFIIQKSKNNKEKLHAAEELLKCCEENIFKSICLCLISFSITDDKDLKYSYLQDSIKLWDKNLAAKNEMLKLKVSIPLLDIVNLLKLNDVDFDDLKINDSSKALVENFEFVSLGGGDEVGRSSYLIKIGNSRILIDSGIKINKNSIEQPNFDFLLENNLISNIDCLIITHAHLDHCGSIIKLYELNDKLRLFLTKETKELMKLNLKQQLKNNNDLYRLEEILERAIVLNYNDPFNIDKHGTTIELYRAGHILGAASVLIKSLHGNIFFTGDFCVENQETVNGIEVPNDKNIDILITESTYGDKKEDNNIKFNKEKFKEYVRSSIKKEKSILIPAFAIGRTQEILLVLKELMEENKFRVYIDGGSTYITKLYNKLLDYDVNANRMYYVQDKTKKSKEYFLNTEIIEDTCCIVSSSGMLLEGSASCEYAKHMLGDKRCSCILTGFQSATTVGEKLKEQMQFKTNRYVEIDNKLYKINCDLKEFNFSAHADITDILALEIALKAKYIILVHGDYQDRKREIEKQLLKIKNVNIYQSKNNEVIKLGGDCYGR